MNKLVCFLSVCICRMLVLHTGVEREWGVVVQIGCVVMASGASARFGANKMLADLAGRPLIRHTLENLPRESLSRVVVVSVYPQVAQLAKQAGFLHAMPDGPGKNDTVRAGILRMEGMDGCLFCVGDQPLCQRTSMQRVIEAFRGRPQSIVRLYAGVIPGNPVLFPKGLFHELENLPPEKGGSFVLRRHPELLVPVQAEHPWELNDADTPEMLTEMEKLLHENGR